MPYEIEKEGPILQLKKSLQGIVEDLSASQETFGNIGPITKSLERIKASFDGQTNSRPPGDQIQQAIKNFLADGAIHNLRQARLTAWGLAMSYSQNPPFFERERQFSEYLNILNEPRFLSRNIWRGLLASYLNYQGSFTKNDIGKGNWEKLRAFLKETFGSIFDQTSQKPEWMTVIRENLNIFDISPCQPYAQAALRGDDQAIKALKETVIPQGSWFDAELIRAQIDFACVTDDSQFKAHLPRLCKLLWDNALSADEGLKNILSRYHQSQDTSEAPELLDLAVYRWNNPKLPSSSRWGLVNPDVKEMALRWLIGKDLRIFFDLFSDECKAEKEKRRLTFWMRYLDQISDAYFVLGKHAYESTEESYVEMRRSNEGRLSRLEQAGSDRNNAFIMILSGYVIVEFGLTGNACFCFERGKEPFQLNAPILKGDRSQLKNEASIGCRFRLVHSDRPYPWEYECEKELEKLGVYADATARIGALRTPTSDRRRFRHHRENQNQVLDSPKAKFTPEELIQFAKKFDLKVVDYRDNGGNLWITPASDFFLIRSQLEIWGFKRIPGKGWWYK